MNVKFLCTGLNKIMSKAPANQRFLGVMSPKMWGAASGAKLDKLTYCGANTAKTVLKKEDVLAKYCAENELVLADVTAMFDKSAAHLDEVSVSRLLKLTNEGKVQLYIPQKKKMVLLMNRVCEDGLIRKKTAGVLNYLEKGNADTNRVLKELLALEKQGKIKGEDISEVLKIHTYDKYGVPMEAECKELISKLRSGEVSRGQIRQAQFFLENGIPLEVCNPKNISKYTKAELGEWSKYIQAIRGESVVSPEIFNEINRQLSALVKVNRVLPKVSSEFLQNFNRSMKVFEKEGLAVEGLAKAGGIELAYSRSALKSDILKEIETLPIAEQNRILSRFGLQNEGDGIFSGIPVLFEGQGLTKAETAINEHISKFLSAENKVVLPKGFEELAPALEKITRAVPEFKFAIGAKQHGIQDYRLAEHMLKAFQENMKNPLYKELGSTDRRILGISTLLHDINKVERTKDFGHALPSSQTVEAIVQRMTDFTPAEKDRIINLVRNHHWLERISDKPEVINELALTFRSGNDFKMAKIFAASDLKAVNNEFFKTYGDKINSQASKAIEEEILKLQSKGRMMFTADVNPARAAQLGGKEVTLGTGATATKNTVISAKQMGLDKEYFGYHVSSDEGMMTVISNGGYGKELCLSISVGKDGACKAFQDGKVFVIFDRLNMNNLAKVASRNANTKYAKSYDKLYGYMKSDGGFVNKFRENYPHEISDTDYALCFREAQNFRLSEVGQNKTIQRILGSESKAKDFETALRKTNDHFVSSATEHSETVALDLRAGAIGVKGKAEDLSYPLRKFLEENHIPIVENIR